MALIAVSGHPGCRFEEVARISAQRLGFELLTQSRIRSLTSEEFGADTVIPDRAWPSLVMSILARLATEHHLVYCAAGGEVQAKQFPGTLRVHVVAPENVRIGNLMLDHRLEREPARKMLLDLETADREQRRARFGKTQATAELFDLVFNSESLSTEQMAELVETAVASGGLRERGYLSHAAEQQLQFHMRMKLARYGIVPPSRVTLRSKKFAHASEEMFANLLDFYRIAWEYEPRTFPIQQAEDGAVLEAFTPDFYLPEYDLYVELTTMKQSLVTRKNRKVRLLREQYPNLNVQVFYQKDFENLIFKYGLAGRPVEA
ncbi:MAG: cytidylate kinase family protein [Acidobacteria bacterium]|nr:cytidylate kinase family protein [Acidobacteriota bacterium]